MPLPFNFDFKNPDYVAVFDWRLQRLQALRKEPAVFDALKLHYRDNPAQFIIDWGCTFDPRNIEIGLPATIPFILYPRQEEWINWFLERWKKRENGLVDKSRTVGLSWLTVALSVSLCLTHTDLVIGFGSRKEEYVDSLGSPKALFYKARQYIGLLPKELRGGWNLRKNGNYMRLSFPETAAVMTGEAGKNIGRGDRTSLYWVDEAAFLEQAESIEASLTETTNCRIDISTVNNPTTLFSRKCLANKLPRFTFHWRDDPRRDQEWYERKCAEIDDPVIVARELDINHTASMKGSVIPALWVDAAIDAHIRLNITPSGIRKAALDIGDEGKDPNAFVGRYGILLDYLELWSGANGGDIYLTVQKAMSLCDLMEYESVDYDADGLGSGARGDSRVENEKRKEKKRRIIPFTPFRGSGSVIDPDVAVFPTAPGQPREKTLGLTNKDYFANLKAQAWWELRRRFQATYRAVVMGLEYKEDEIISISSSIPNLYKLKTELSQPIFVETKDGKMLVDKAPDDAPSPNAADAVMMVFAPARRKFRGMFSV